MNNQMPVTSKDFFSCRWKSKDISQFTFYSYEKRKMNRFTSNQQFNWPEQGVTVCIIATDVLFLWIWVKNVICFA